MMIFAYINTFYFHSLSPALSPSHAKVYRAMELAKAILLTSDNIYIYMECIQIFLGFILRMYKM